MGNRRRRCEGVIESSLYQIMTGAILSVLGRCSFFPLLLLLVLLLMLLAAATLTERTKSNDESNSITFPCLASPSLTPLPRPESCSPSGRLSGKFRRWETSFLLRRRRFSRLRSDSAVGFHAQRDLEGSCFVLFCFVRLRPRQNDLPKTLFS